MWGRKAAGRTDPLGIIGAVVAQILFAIYGFGVVVWCLKLGAEYHFDHYNSQIGPWIVIFALLGALDLGLLVGATYRIIKVVRFGTTWDRMGIFLALELILFTVTIFALVGPFLEAIGFD